MMNAHPDFSEDIASEARSARISRAWEKVLQYRWFIMFVIVPVALAGLYFGLIASDQYVSESRFVVKSPGQRSAQVSTLASLVQTTGLSAGQEQTNEILGYIRSRDALKALQRQIDVKAAYSVPYADFIARFPGFGYDNDKFDDIYDFYEGKVKAKMDNETGMAVLQVRAFNPADAQRINAGLLGLSENLVNQLNERARRKGIEEGERRVRSAEERLRNARVALGAYRQQSDLIDPKGQSEGIYQVVMQLTAQRAALQAQLQQMMRVAPRNPAIPSLQGRIAGMSSQIAGQSARVVGNNGGIAAKLGGYENLAMEQEFATQNLTAANAALETARVEAEKQQFYLERVVEPAQPDVAQYPKRLVSILTVAGAALCLYLIGWMLVVGILEHAPED